MFNMFYNQLMALFSLMLFPKYGKKVVAGEAPVWGLPIRGIDQITPDFVKALGLALRNALGIDTPTIKTALPRFFVNFTEQTGQPILFTFEKISEREMVALFGHMEVIPLYSVEGGLHVYEFPNYRANSATQRVMFAEWLAKGVELFNQLPLQTPVTNVVRPLITSVKIPVDLFPNVLDIALKDPDALPKQFGIVKETWVPTEQVEAASRELIGATGR